MWMLIATLLLTPTLPFAQDTPIGGTPPDAAKERARAVDRAKAHLAETLKLIEQDIVLESAKETRWPNSSLGCPEKGMMYAQMVTPGWTVVLKAQGRSYEVHVAGKRAVTCPAADKAPGGR
jgi:hypothetical protein